MSALTAPTLEAARRVVFLGDSITYNGWYVDAFETALRLHRPSWRGEFLNLGLPSETVSGLSEAGHAGGEFPRPVLAERLERVLARARPDLIVACYGMNDGVYQSFSVKKMLAFRAGAAALRARATAAGAEIIFLTPPVFDPVAWRLTTALTPSREPPAHPRYDHVLTRYSGWLTDQREFGWDVIDVHTLMKRELFSRTKADPAFTFSPDGIHPGPLGHATIARALWSGFGYPHSAALESMFESEVDRARFELIRARAVVLRDAWLTATGHRRPGIPAGRPLPEADKIVAAMNARLESMAPRCA